MEQKYQTTKTWKRKLIMVRAKIYVIKIYKSKSISLKRPIILMIFLWDWKETQQKYAWVEWEYLIIIDLGTSESTVKQHYSRLLVTYVDTDGFLAKCKNGQN